MHPSESIELLSFRRTFTLLIVLVVLPSAGLTGMGVVAIVNERAAVEKRLEDAWRGRLAAVETGLTRAFAGAHLETDGARPFLEVAGHRVHGEPFRLAGGQVLTGEPHVTALLGPHVARLQAVREQPVVLSVDSGHLAVLVAAVQRSDETRGLVLSKAELTPLIEALARGILPPGEHAHVALEAVKRELPEGVMARLVAGMSGVGDAAPGTRELASLTLPPPVEDFRLIGYADGGDPVEQASTRNRWLYGALLSLFYGTLVVGVVFTGRTLYREAKLSRLKTDFVSLVSHELRTPLTSIRMFIEMLAQRRIESPEQTQQVLELLGRETERLSALVETVLDWARLESGRTVFDLGPCAPAAVAAQAVEALRAQSIGSNVELSVSVPDDLPTVRADRDALAGAVVNLLQNAFKYSQSGTPRVALRAVARGKEVVFEIEDHGLGIARRELRRVFDRFYRVDNLLTRSTQGSGLGLSIAQRIVHAHGGRLSVDSVVGKGSTFRIHLPIARRAAEPPAVRSAGPTSVLKDATT